MVLHANAAAAAAAARAAAARHAAWAAGAACSVVSQLATSWCYIGSIVCTAFVAFSSDFERGRINPGLMSC